MGLLGPIIQLETFDTAIIHFKNLASIPYSIHGIGVSYRKRSEGAVYDDGTIKEENGDGAVSPGQEYKYIWSVPESYGPTESDPPCLPSVYYSHTNSSYDINSGLVGIILICKPGSLSEDGPQYENQEKIFALMVFDERLSHYNHKFKDDPLHTINGHINGSIPEQILCKNRPTYFHVIGFGTHVDVHRFSLEGHSFVLGDHRVPSLPVTAFSFRTAIVHPAEKGAYAISCPTRNHPEGKMISLIKVEECAARPEMRSDINDDEEDDDYYDSKVLDQTDYTTHLDIRSHGKRKAVTWIHYIAAVEVEWDYQQTKKTKRPRFTKVMYKEFTSAKFTNYKLTEIPGTGILGPILRGEVGDQIQIVFKNLARYPFNMYPQGLSSVQSIHPSLTGDQLKEYPVYQNDTITYIWPLTSHDSPASSDPRCLTRFYASFLNLQKDLASGLIGPLLICSKQTLDQEGNQFVTDKEHMIFFSVFDETLSWYHEENIKKENSTNAQNRNDWSPKYTINGIINFLQISICQNEATVWHLLNVGLETELLPVYFGGNTFLVDSSYQEMLTLFPMNGKTINLLMEKTGKWPVMAKNHLADIGMKATLSVLHCENNHDEYIDYDDPKDFDHNASFYYNFFSPSYKTPPTEPAMNLNNNQNLNYLNNIIKDGGHVMAAARNVNPASYNEINKSPKTEKRDIPNTIRDNTEKSSSTGKKLQNDDFRKITESNVIDFYDDEYSNSYDEYVDLYDDQWSKDPRSPEGQVRTYFIAVEEVIWDYGAGKSAYSLKDIHYDPRAFQSYKKAVFREYLDSSFKEPALRGERDVHLGLLGPCIRAEVNDEIIIQFKNMASRPFSFYSNVLSAQWNEEDTVPPQNTRTYSGKVSLQFGPTGSEEDCRIWFYTSNSHSYKDFHSGLIGPLLVCRPKVLKKSIVHQILMEDFSLIFMKIDETKSWYFQENWQQNCPSVGSHNGASYPPGCRSLTPLDDVHIFHAINGYVDNSLPGLILQLERKIRWHLLSIGRADIVPIQFHGNILSQKSRPLSIVNLYPGVGITLEMTAHMTGLWLIEPEGVSNNHKMTALYIVYDPKCHQPLGISSGKIKDSQITASGHYGSWVPYLARLGNSGAINAWSVKDLNSWIQVDFLEPLLVLSVQTQGAHQRFVSLYISQYIVFYSLNGEKWSQYQGNSSNNHMVFFGNVDSSSIHENHFNPPIIARFIRLQAIHMGVRGGLRMEFFGCDLTSCFMPLGMQSGVISPYQLSASSSLHSIFASWVPDLARLYKQGRVNAWRPQTDSPGQWFQVDLGLDRKVTGLMIQGARSFTSMYITHFSLSFSSDSSRWKIIQSAQGQPQIFHASKDSDNPVFVTFKTPFTARFLKLHPEKWKGGIALRMEVLGCSL
ncbi:coagulation factor VIII-like [Gastrophryne carolinensis]